MRRSGRDSGVRLPDHVPRTRLAVASIDGGESFWGARRDGTDTGAMVLEDVLPLLRERGLSPKPVVLMVLSMGGYDALLLAAAPGPPPCADPVTNPSRLRSRPGRQPSARARIASSVASTLRAVSTCRFSIIRPLTVTTPRPSATAASNAAMISCASAIAASLGA